MYTMYTNAPKKTPFYTHVGLYMVWIVHLPGLHATSNLPYEVAQEYQKF